ncbi:hypothetical protein BVG19_g1520 [[Candida] boidinii]|nr:hypothetical protein BVG19_g1520 [[Candida] boidinii]OWB53454.1 hypothetical protein B5S27_g5051 [[Candida] boidinii]
MVGFSINIHLMKKWDKVLTITLSFVTLVIFSFLLVGCTKDTSSYSEVYLVEIGFNEQSVMYDSISTAYDLNNSTEDLSSMKVRVGYLGLCVEFNDDLICDYSKNTETFDNYPSISLYDSSSNKTTASLDLIKLSKELNQKIASPDILIIALSLNLLIFLNQFYLVIPFMPYKYYSIIFGISACTANVIIWGCGAISGHVISDSVSKLISISSLYILDGSVGKRFKIMSWFCFAALAVIGIVDGILLFKEIKLRKENQQVGAQQKLEKQKFSGFGTGNKASSLSSYNSDGTNSLSNSSGNGSQGSKWNQRQFV